MPSDVLTRFFERLKFIRWAKIYPPDVPSNDPDRFLRCQDALHLEFAALVDRAVAAGWRADEVLTTIIELADNHALMLAARPSSKKSRLALQPQP
ncbi:hypothetical protein [Rhizobium leguminosarum]|uniref:hypothetical protein n=1 Tax=Rhizobium leguminosarum TaxID=384 RepID=UPI001C9110C3|nr:hypothetical protein [Rhizobium leguminosarum]MBY2909936.1 hypothetical protein [Rhizobium leguminosarum]